MKCGRRGIIAKADEFMALLNASETQLTIARTIAEKRTGAIVAEFTA